MAARRVLEIYRFTWTTWDQCRNSSLYGSGVGLHNFFLNKPAWRIVWRCIREDNHKKNYVCQQSAMLLKFLSASLAVQGDNWLEGSNAHLLLFARSTCGWPNFMFNMVWMIYLAAVKLNYDWLSFILKGGKSEFWPLCLPSVATG